MSTANTVALLEIDMVAAGLLGRADIIRDKDWFWRDAASVAAEVISAMIASGRTPYPAAMHVLQKALDKGGGKVDAPDC